MRYSRSILTTFALTALASVLLTDKYTALAESSKSSPAQSAVVTSEVMHFLHSRTTLPLLGPSYVPARPQMDPAPFSYVGASVEVTKNSYEVALTYIDIPLRINSPKLKSEQYSGLARTLGNFGVTQYGSESLALAKVHKLMWKTSGPYSRRSLSSGVISETTNISAPYTLLGPGIVTWHQYGWTFQVTDGPLKYDLDTARTLVTYLVHHPMKHGHGVLVVDNAGDGQHSEAMWIDGPMVLNCGNYHDAQEAIRMVESMKA